MPESTHSERADSDAVNAGSPETPPPPKPVGGRGRLAPVLRLLLAGSLAAALLSPVGLQQWAESRPLLLRSPLVQTLLEDLDQTLGAIGFPQGYAWLRRQTRALQALRFSAGADNAQ